VGDPVLVDGQSDGRDIADERFDAAGRGQQNDQRLEPLA